MSSPTLPPLGGGSPQEPHNTSPTQYPCDVQPVFGECQIGDREIDLIAEFVRIELGDDVRKGSGTQCLPSRVDGEMKAILMPLTAEVEIEDEDTEGFEAYNNAKLRGHNFLTRIHENGATHVEATGELYKDDEIGKIIRITDLYTGGDLQTYSKDKPLAQKLQLLNQALEGIIEACNAHVYSLDIKGRNFYIDESGDDPTVKMGDIEDAVYLPPLDPENEEWGEKVLESNIWTEEEEISLVFAQSESSQAVVDDTYQNQLNSIRNHLIEAEEIGDFDATYINLIEQTQKELVHQFAVMCIKNIDSDLITGRHSMKTNPEQGLENQLADESRVKGALAAKGLTPNQVSLLIQAIDPDYANRPTLEEMKALFS